MSWAAMMGGRGDLEHLLESGYQELKKYVKSPKPATLDKMNGFYQRAYDRLKETCSPPTYSFICLRKGSDKVGMNESFIYQTILMVNLPPKKDKFSPFLIEENPNDGMGGLKAYIDAVEPFIRTPTGVVFRTTQIKAAELREAGRYAELLNAMDYIGTKYSAGTTK